MLFRFPALSLLPGVNLIADDKAASILSVDIVSYDYKEGIASEEDRFNRTGVIAEDVKHVITEVVSYIEIDGIRMPDGIDFSRFVPYVIQTVQIQQRQLDTLFTTLLMLITRFELIQDAEGLPENMINRNLLKKTSYRKPPSLLHTLVL